MVNVKIDYLRTFNYNLYKFDNKICHSVKITNNSESVLKDLRLECQGEQVERCEVTVCEKLEPNESIEITEFTIRPKEQLLKELPEHFVTNFDVTLTSEGQPVYEEVYDLEHDSNDLSHLYEKKRELTKFDIWERKLLDFSLRNSLLNLSMRRRAIQIMSFDVDKIEDALQDGVEYCIQPKLSADIKLSEEEKLVSSKEQESFREMVLEEIKKKVLHTYQTETETANTLKNIYRAGRNAIEETGANSLFLTIGTLRWYETPQSDTPRYAPLLLMPVEMVYKKGNYFVRSRDEDIQFNITLVEFLRQNHEISLNFVNSLPKDEYGVDVKLIFAAMRDALKGKERWEVEEECVLGTFSFSKFLMWNDVHNNREALLSNDVVSSLVENQLTWQPAPVNTNLSDLDSTMKPTDVALPVAVDSSQLAAVLEGGQGHSFILYGPPGTGKSQTITNLIANALFQGKRVLFVAEKMAALSVVQNRLAKIGLAPFCLELHSNKATKRHVLKQLEDALQVAHIVEPAEYASTADKLYQHRQELLEYINELHKIHKDQGSLSLFDCITKYESIKAEQLDGFVFDKKIDNLLSAEGVNGIEELMGERLEALLRLVGQPSAHPLNGLRLSEKQIMDVLGTISGMQKSRNVIAEIKPRLGQLAEARDLRAKILRDNNESIFSEDANSLYQQWAAAKAKWFIPRFFAKRSFVQSMKKFNSNVTSDSVDSMLDQLLTYSEKHGEIKKLHESLSPYFKYTYGTDELPETSYLDAATLKLERWEKNADKMRDWLHWSQYSDELEAKGLASVIAQYEKAEYSAADIKERFLKALLKHKIETFMSGSSLMATFEGMLFDEKVNMYRQLAERYQMLTQKELYARLAKRIPRVTDNLASSSEIGVLNRNISNGGRGMSLRGLFDQIPSLLPRLCPCMLMSPISVAQYLDLAQEKFDLVVFDEASQMPTSEAVGAIARGKSLIVVGDPKQMPPTSFFTSTNVDEDEAFIDDMESILEDCRTLEIPSLQLNWHYRSRHESLIAFSNNEYYDGQLITFPSSDDQQTKVSLVPISGYYDKGGKRSNKAEAEAIVAEVVRRLQSPELAKQSIGVIAFSVVQQSLIEDLLQNALDENHKLQEVADSMYEPIFVKNLENVQGDERDVILFSIGYGPDKDGKVSMNFGPLNNGGGERRLNVAVSRARQEMIVFSTMKSSQIDLNRTKARGVEGLKHFLEYAETHTLPKSHDAMTSGDVSVIAKQIAEELNARGYVATTDIGRSKFHIDVAISQASSPDTYELGILLDGRGYRSTQTTRDREIVQPSVLTSLKWKVMRVWSIDWYNNKERVLSRIIEKLNEKPVEAEPAKVQKFDISNEKTEEIPTAMREYEEYVATKAASTRMSDKELVKNILKKEQPITFALLCRRVCTLRNLSRVTPTIQRDLTEVVEQNFYTHPDRDGIAVWLSKADSEGYAFYRPASGRDVTDIPMAEIRNVVREAITEQFALQRDQLTLIAAKKLGFTRRGPNVDLALSKALQKLIESGEIIESEGKLTVL